MKVYEALARGLMDHGADTLFGVMGDSNLFMIDSYVREHGGTYVAAAHEAGAVLMAYGYALRSEQLGVATTTHGPGLTNTATALVEAVKGNVPLLLLSGDTPPTQPWNHQNVDQREIVHATGAGFQPVGDGNSIMADLSLAIRRALVERRPIVLNVPAELLWRDTDYHLVPTGLLRPQVAAAPDATALDVAVGIVASARRPLVLLGRGAIRSREAIMRLADRLGAPVATTLGARGLLDGDTASVGVFGTLSTPDALEVIETVDCVIAFGASLNRWTTVAGSLTGGRAVVQCDIAWERIGQHHLVDAGVVGDAGVVADAMYAMLERLNVPPASLRVEVQRRTMTAPEAPGTSQMVEGSSGSMDATRAFRLLDEALPRSRTLVTDGGRFILRAWTLVQVEDPRAFMYAIAFGSIGLGMGTAIGAAVASPRTPTVLITGDGGFMNGGITEFNTAVRLGTDLIVIVCNDGAYGSEHIQFVERGMDPELSVISWPDLAPVAEALGGRGITMRQESDMDEVRDAIEHRTAPLLIDIKVDPAAMGEGPR